MGTKVAGEEEEKWVKGRMNWWGGASGFRYVRLWYAILSRSAEQKHFCSGSRECIRNTPAREVLRPMERDKYMCPCMCRHVWSLAANCATGLVRPSDWRLQVFYWGSDAGAISSFDRYPVSPR